MNIIDLILLAIPFIALYLAKSSNDKAKKLNLELTSLKDSIKHIDKTIWELRQRLYKAELRLDVERKRDEETLEQRKENTALKESVEDIESVVLRSNEVLDSISQTANNLDSKMDCFAANAARNDEGKERNGERIDSINSIQDNSQSSLRGEAEVKAQVQHTQSSLREMERKRNDEACSVANPNLQIYNLKNQNTNLSQQINNNKSESAKLDDKNKENLESKKDKNIFNLEMFFTQKAMVFIAGIFFILASVFFIKYSLENNLITPAIRISLSIAFGLLLSFCGALLRYKGQSSVIYRIYTYYLIRVKPLLLSNESLKTKLNALANSGNPHALQTLSYSTIQRIIQTLIGTGLIVLYLSFYGGFIFYGFFGDLLTLLLLAIVSFIGLFLSVHVGLIIGIFGLIGGFLAPILLASDSYNAIFLFAYLAIYYFTSMYFAYRYGKDRESIFILAIVSNAFMLLCMFDFLSKSPYVENASLIGFFICIVYFFANIIMYVRCCNPLLQESAILSLQGKTQAIHNNNTTNNQRTNGEFLLFTFMGFAICGVFCFMLLLNSLPYLRSLEHILLSIFCIIALYLPQFARQKNLIEWQLIAPLATMLFFIVIMFGKIDSSMIDGNTSNFYLLYSSLFLAFTLFHLYKSENKILFLWIFFAVVLSFIIMYSTHYVDIKNLYFENIMVDQIINLDIRHKILISSIFLASVIFIYINASKDIAWARHKSLDYLLLLCAASFIISSMFNVRGLYIYPFWLLIILVFACLGNVLRRDIANFHYVIMAFSLYVFLLYRGSPFYISNLNSMALSLVGFNSLHSLGNLPICLISTLIALALMRKKEYVFKKYVDSTLACIVALSIILMVDSIRFTPFSYPFTTMIIGVMLIALIYAKGFLYSRIKGIYNVILYIFMAKCLYDICVFGLMLSNPFLHDMLVDNIAMYLLGFIGSVVIIYKAKPLLGSDLYIGYAIDTLIFALGLFALIFAVELAFLDKSDSIWTFSLTTPIYKSYVHSVAIVLSGALLLWLYFRFKINAFRIYSLALFVLVTLKAFFIDATMLAGLAKVSLFVFMGAAFLLLSYIYSKYVFKDKHNAA